VSKNKLPPDVIKHWPEIFEDVEIHAVPIEYIRTVHVHFHDGKIWEIDMDKQGIKQQNDVSAIENSLETFLTQYNDEIDHVDFRLNTSKVVEDVKKRTKSFMKKRK
jgi:hypothetical protein